MINRLFPVIAVITLVQSCANSEAPNEHFEEKTCWIPDGPHSAKVLCENPSTSTIGEYILEVDIVSNQIAVIHFNKGYLDDDHIISQYHDTLDCSIHLTDDRNRHLTIQILN